MNTRINSPTSSRSIVIADLGTGNLHSVKKAVEYVADGRPVTITHDPEVIGNADYLVLPGQGAIGTWLAQLAASADLEAAIKFRILNGPCLGICLGLQALFEYSEENGGCKGLGVLNGSVCHFSAQWSSMRANGLCSQDLRLKIPHMGWNEVHQTQAHPLWQGIKDRERFYFVHSYFAQSTTESHVVGQCEYGHRFTAAAATGNIFATQFHPEKSQSAGLQILKNFVNWNGDF